jgi:hypothetical protein
MSVPLKIMRGFDMKKCTREKYIDFYVFQINFLVLAGGGILFSNKEVARKLLENA